jgi:hypothetical protein
MSLRSSRSFGFSALLLCACAADGGPERGTGEVAPVEEQQPRPLNEDAALTQTQTPEPARDVLPGDPNGERKDEMGLTPTLHGAELLERSKLAYQRGFDFLVATQNSDGSWGSHDPKVASLRDFGFQLLNRGSQDGVRLACTAIVAKALLRKPSRSAAEEQALVRAVEALSTTDKIAYEMGEAFNTWGYGFKLDFLCDWLETPLEPDARARTIAAAKVCVDGLRAFQQADGGWNYYAGPMAGGESMSFNTANFSEAAYRARKLGVPVPDGMVEDAAKLLQRMRTVRGGVVYDARFLLSPGSVNELSAASRTAAVTEALAEMGVLEDGAFERSLQVFDEGENWLEDGRKLIIPHTAVDQVSGYFFFYGYYYLSEFSRRIPDRVPRERWERNAWTMIRTQEENGSWWDTAAADYGDKWGTGFALLTLQRYFELCPTESITGTNTADATSQ